MQMLRSRLDYCRVWLAGFRAEGSSSRERFLVVSVPLTQAGAAYLAEEKEVREVAVLLWMARPAVGEEWRGFATPDALLRKLREMGSGGGDTVVALTAPDETPPAGGVGYYSDGAEHAATVTVAGTGRRLFIEVSSGNVIRTNVMGFLVADEVTPPVPVAQTWRAPTR
jgi:hypothetical protein